MQNSNTVSYVMLSCVGVAQSVLAPPVPIVRCPCVPPLPLWPEIPLGVLANFTCFRQKSLTVLLWSKIEKSLGYSLTTQP